MTKKKLKNRTGDMTASEYLTHTLTRLRQAWSGPPPTFMDLPLSDPEAITRRMLAENANEEDVHEFLEAVHSYKKKDPLKLTLALRTLIENGSELASRYRYRALSMSMGDRHDMGEDYIMATIQYTLAYLHGDDRGFYHMASEVEGRNRARDADGYLNAVHFLANAPEDAATAIKSIPKADIVGIYPPKYFEELATALEDHPDLKKALTGDFLVYRAASAVRKGLDRSRAWGMHMDALRTGITEHALKNPYVRDAFMDRPLDREITS